MSDDVSDDVFPDDHDSLCVDCGRPLWLCECGEDEDDEDEES